MSPLEKLIMQKREAGRTMSPVEQKAKMGNLESLRDEMSGMMKGDLHPAAAKVEVAAKNPADLRKGLDLAKKVLPEDGEHEEADESPEEESMESPEEEAAEETEEESHEPSDAVDAGSDSHTGAEGLSHEEIDQLQMLLDKLKNSKIS